MSPTSHWQKDSWQPDFLQNRYSIWCSKVSCNAGKKSSTAFSPSTVSNLCNVGQSSFWNHHISQHFAWSVMQFLHLLHKWNCLCLENPSESSIITVAVRALLTFFLPNVPSSQEIPSVKRIPVWAEERKCGNISSHCYTCLNDLHALSFPI